MISLILPTYNEAKNLPELIPALGKALSHVPHEIIIVDDNSPDETWKIARTMAEKNPHLRVIRRIGRRGLSSAVIEGFLAASGETLAVMDADGQHDLSLVPKLAKAIDDGADMAIGSRYMEGGSVGQWDERRHAMSRMATRLAQRLCRVKANDPMSGFFAVRRSTFEAALPQLNPMGFKILLDLLVHVPRSTKVAELPFTFGTRLHGESKLSRRVQVEFLEYLYDVACGRYVPLIFVQYCVVGVLGVGVNLLGYSLTLATGQPFVMAAIVGIELAIVFNFTLNNLWTFKQARLRGMKMVTGLLKYNAACALGALANYAIIIFLRDASGWHVLPSVAVGALIGTIWNYTMSRSLTWHA